MNLSYPSADPCLDVHSGSTLHKAVNQCIRFSTGVMCYEMNAMQSQIRGHEDVDHHIPRKEYPIRHECLGQVPPH
jgi:hypothetical protein